MVKKKKINRERMVSIGKLIRSQRLLKGYTQQTLAYRAGVDSSKVSNLENGLIERPQLPTIMSIADALGVHIGVFFIHCVERAIEVEE